MNVFEKVKGRFQNVQQDLYDGLKALTSLDSQPRHGMLQQLHSDGVNLDSGADLLNKYQKTWKELQDITVENAQRGENVDCQIGLLFVRWDRQLETMGRLESEVKELPDVLSMISQITDTLGYVEESCKSLEVALERCEDLCEEQRMQREKNNHSLQLASYKKRRTEELDKVKAQLSKAHTKTMQTYERKRLSKLKEREEVFLEAFSHDVNYYQTHGHIEKLAMTNIPIPKVTSLSEITLEQDDQDLDKFLESTEAENTGLSVANITIPEVSSLTDVSVDQANAGLLKFLDSSETDNSQNTAGTRKHGTSITEPDGTFFEDDYTADYTADYSIPSSDRVPDHVHKEPNEAREQNLENTASKQSGKHDQYKNIKTDAKDSTELENVGTENKVLDAASGDNVQRKPSKDSKDHIKDSKDQLKDSEDEGSKKTEDPESNLEEPDRGASGEGVEEDKEENEQSKDKTEIFSELPNDSAESDKTVIDGSAE